MPQSLFVIGAPSSAGAYAPGQEQAPAVLRRLGLLEQLQQRGITVTDGGDVPGFRWQPDKTNLHAMNIPEVAAVARAVAERVRPAPEDATVLVLGGDCTVELGTVAGIQAAGDRVGLIYIDRDTDLKTPHTTTEGALDWMGVAHLLGVPGTVPELVGVGSRKPRLAPEQVFFFAHDNVTPSEAELITSLGMRGVPLSAVARDPKTAAREALAWAAPFNRLLIHLDLDVLDFADMPLAENTRRNSGLSFAPLIEALVVLVQAPNLAALTVTELNPNHSDEVTLRGFITALVEVLSTLPPTPPRSANP